jgi:hypothetical protein
MRIGSRFLVVLNLACLLAACVETTTATWSHPTHSETVSHFFVTEDARQLVFIGREYHYIFPDASSLIDILNWSDRGLLRGEFSAPFRLDSQNVITGTYAISCTCNDVTSGQVRWLEQKGFERAADTEGASMFRKVGHIAGTRYASGGIRFPTTLPLNDRYEIDIQTDFTSAGIVGRAALTPIAVAEDGIATVGLGYLVLIAAPFAVADMVIEELGPE